MLAFVLLAIAVLLTLFLLSRLRREDFFVEKSVVVVGVHETTKNSFVVNMEDADSDAIQSAQNIAISLTNGSKHAAAVTGCAPLPGGAGSNGAVKWNYVTFKFAPDLSAEDAAAFKSYSRTTFGVSGQASGGRSCDDPASSSSAAPEYYPKQGSSPSSSSSGGGGGRGCGKIFDKSANKFAVTQTGPPADLFPAGSASKAVPQGGDLVDKAGASERAKQRYDAIKTTACGMLGSGPPEKGGAADLSWDLVIAGSKKLPLPNDAKVHYAHILKPDAVVKIYKNDLYPLACVAYGGSGVASRYDGLLKVVHDFFYKWAVPLRLILTHNQTVPVVLSIGTFKASEIAMPVGGGASPIGKELCTGVVLGGGDASEGSAATVIHEFMHALFPRTSCDFTSVFGTCPFPSEGPYDAVMYGEGMAEFISRYVMDGGKIADPAGDRVRKNAESYFGALLPKTHRALDGLIQMSNYNTVIASNAQKKLTGNDAYMACLPYMLSTYNQDPADPGSKQLTSDHAAEGRWFSRYGFVHFYYYVAAVYGLGAFVAMQHHMGESGSLLESLSVLLNVHPSDLMAQFVLDLLRRTPLGIDDKADLGPMVKEFGGEQQKKKSYEIDWKAFVVFKSDARRGRAVEATCGPNAEGWRCVELNADGSATVFKGGKISASLSPTSKYFVVCSGGIAYDDAPAKFELS